MNAAEMWNRFVAENKIQHSEYEEWAFGDAPDELADLVLSGIKTGTSSAYPLYELENEPLPQAGEYSVILDSKAEAVCVIKTTNVEIFPFRDVGESHAYKEGEGDKSLNYWQKLHKAFFKKCMEDAGLVFDENMLVVYEEFEVVYSGKDLAC